MDILLDVIEVNAIDNFKLHLLFENGEKRIFDMLPYLDLKPFSCLKNSHIFNMAKVDYGTVVWPGHIDIAPETLYERSTPA